VDNARSVSYTFDALNRLTQAVTAGDAAYPRWGLAMTYDRYGNRTAQSIFSGCVAPMTCPTNSVTIDATTNRITGSGYSYDANGNMTQDGVNTLTYDAENHLISSSGPGGSATYSYDGNGRRVEKAVSGGTTTVYIFSGAQVIAEYENGAAPASPTREYISSGSAPLAKIEGSSTIYYLRDHLSNRVLMDANGNVVAAQGNYPFGELWYPTSGPLTKWEFTSYERDAESGNDYAMARYQVNRLGRFSSPDPLGGHASDPQSLNRFPYVESDPVNLTDPLGLGQVPCPPASTSDFCIETTATPVLDVGFLLFALGYYPSWRQFLPLGNFDPPGGDGGGGGDGNQNSKKDLPDCKTLSLDNSSTFWNDSFATEEQVQAFFESQPKAPGTWDGYAAADAFQRAGINPARAVGIIGAETSFGNGPRLSQNNINNPFSAFPGGKPATNYAQSLSAGLGTVVNIQAHTSSDSTPLTALIDDQNDALGNGVPAQYEGDDPATRLNWLNSVNFWFRKFAKSFGKCK
jgi:RHS repeat-associated protein